MRMLKFAIQMVLVLIVILIAMLLVFEIQLSGFDVDPAARVEIAGLGQKAEICFDSEDMAHITAASQKDLLIAWGYFAASRRLWQMELMRRAARGTLAEVFGKSTLSFDHHFRNLQFDSLAALQYRRLSEESRDWLDWYTQGVNGFIEEASPDTPLEFQMMEVRPQKWRPQDALIVYNWIAWLLEDGWKVDLLKWNLSERLPPAMLAEIGMTAADISEFKKLPREGMDVLEKMWRTENLFHTWWGISGQDAAGFGWVGTAEDKGDISGSLLSIAPFGSNLPFDWIELALQAPGISCAGISIPGVPGIVAGLNAHLVWAMNHLPLRSSDFYLIRMDDAGKAELAGDTARISIYSERQAVFLKHAKQPEVLFTRRTALGPIVKTIPAAGGRSQYGLGIRWSGWEAGGEIRTFREMIQSEDLASLRRSLQYYSQPGQRVVFCDQQGNSGGQIAGRADPGSKNRGTQKALRNDPAAFVTGSDLAQQEIRFLSHPGLLWQQTREEINWQEAQFRAFRQCLSDTSACQPAKLFSPANLEDRWGIHLLLPQWLEIMEGCSSGNAQADSLREAVLWVLTRWDMQPEYREVADIIFPLWRRFIMDGIFRDKLRPELLAALHASPEIGRKLLNRIYLSQDERWFHGVGRAASTGKKEIVCVGFEQILNLLVEKEGQKLYAWNERNDGIKKVLREAAGRGDEGFRREEGAIEGYIRAHIKIKTGGGDLFWFKAGEKANYWVLRSYLEQENELMSVVMQQKHLGERKLSLRSGFFGESKCLKNIILDSM